MKTKVLVTGHRGFIGSALVSKLQEHKRFETIGISRSDGKRLLNASDLLCYKKAAKVVHLAGSVGVQQSWENPFDTYQNNIISTLTVLEFVRLQKIPVIYMSSYIYGVPKYLPVDEVHPINCGNPYANSKRQAEILCASYAEDFGVPVTILRLFNLYGPCQTQDSLIPYIVNQAKENKEIHVKDLRPKRDYLYIDDLVDALTRIVQSEQKGFEVYNLGFGRSYSVQEIINIVQRLTGKQLPVFSSEERRPNEIMDCYCNLKKFSDRFNWQPKVKIEEGISNLLE